MYFNAHRAAFAVALAFCVVVVAAGQGHPDRFSALWGSRYSVPPQPGGGLDRLATATGTAVPDTSPDRMHHWNGAVMDIVGLDHAPVTAGETRVYGEQLGPGRAARAMAIIHIAIFDAVNSISQRYHGFTRIADVPPDSSLDAAIAQAAHDTLVALYPSRQAHCDELLAADLAAIPPGAAKVYGIATGRRAARAILALTARDGSNHEEPLVGAGYIAGDAPGEWRPDPVSGSQIALGAHWGNVRPLVIRSAVAHRVPPPPALTSREYARAFNEVRQLGGDGVTTPTVRTNDQTMAGIFWAYDGTPTLGPPPRLFNQIVMAIADQQGTDMVDLARVLALVNVAMSDSGIAAWESKYHYKVWRPVTGIRESDPGTGPTGRGDGNPLTAGDPAYTPLGAQASNLLGPNFTPPFPAYPSGHATFGGAVFQMLRHVYRTNAIAFTFTSEELDGVTLDNTGVPRPLLPRSFATLSQAEEENGQSRMYLGIHWAFDKTSGVTQGRRIADEVFRNAARPRS
jgi:PAP2 superfamily